MPVNPIILVTEEFRNDTVIDIIDSVAENDATYYMFAGRNIPWPNNDIIISTPTDAKEIIVDTYQNMIFGKVVTNNDVVVLAPRYDWVVNTVFTQWDDQNTNLYSKPFYTVVNATSQYHIFECLYNNNNAPSISQ